MQNLNLAVIHGNCLYWGEKHKHGWTVLMLNWGGVFWGKKILIEIALSLWSSVLPRARWTPAVPVPVFRRGPEQLCNKYRCSRDSSDLFNLVRWTREKGQEIIRTCVLWATGSYMDNIATSMSNKSDANMEQSDSQGSNDTIKITPQFAHHFKPKVSRFGDLQNSSSYRAA